MSPHLRTVQDCGATSHQPCHTVHLPQLPLAPVQQSPWSLRPGLASCVFSTTRTLSGKPAFAPGTLLASHTPLSRGWSIPWVSWWLVAREPEAWVP